MANATTTVTVRTKLTKDSVDSKKTELSLVWDVDQDTIISLAQRAVVIQQQAIYRTSGIIPTTETVNVSEVIAKQPRTSTNTPGAIAAKAAKDPEFMKELLAQLGVKK